MASRSVIAVTIAVVVFSVGVLLYVASISGFNPSQRIITDNVDGMETQQVENPERLDHPAFPPGAGNLSSGNVSTSQ